MSEALQVSYGASAPRRLVATVLLDAVNEAALNLVASSRGMSNTHRDNFDSLKGKVETELGTSWRAVRTTWRDVKRLHEARNLAQHQQVGTDGAQLASWRIATEQFTTSLIQVAFGRSIASIRLSDAIHDAEMRTLFAKAEDLFARKQLVDVATFAFDAFDLAHSEWKRQTESARTRVPFRPSRRSITDSSSFEYLEKVINATAELQRSQVFGLAADDYIWFTTIRSDDAETYTEDEVERLLSFVFWWIVEWEAVSEYYVNNRKERFLRSSRKSRTDAVAAQVADVQVNPLNPRPVIGSDGSLATDTTSEWRVSLRLIDVPASDSDFLAWSYALPGMMEQVENVRGVSVDLAGTVSFYLLVRDPSSLGSDLDRVKQSLIDVEVRLVEQRAAVDAASNARDIADRDYRSGLSSVRQSLPSWVTNVAPGYFMDDLTEPCVLVTTSLSDATYVPGLFRRQSDFERVLESDDHLQITPRLAPAALAEVLNRVDAIYIAQVEARSAEIAAATAQEAIGNQIHAHLSPRGQP